jgi:hypothetical protein
MAVTRHAFESPRRIRKWQRKAFQPSGKRAIKLLPARSDRADVLPRNYFGFGNEVNFRPPIAPMTAANKKMAVRPL